MSQPQNIEEVWEEIQALGREIRRSDPSTTKYVAWFKEEIEQRRGRYAFMADAKFGVSSFLSLCFAL